MRTLLTIGEMAEMMDMSKSQIRFYEAEGLITPTRLEGNNYRLYNFEEMLQLVAINQLKGLDLPLVMIKERLFRSEGYKYEELINTSIKNLSMEIKQLSQKKKIMESSLKEFLKIQNQEFIIKSYKSRKVYILSKIANKFPSIKELYDLYEKYQLNLFEYTHDLYTIHKDNNQIWLGTHNKDKKHKLKDLPTLTIPAGTYLSNTSLVSENIDIINSITKLKNEAAERGLTIKGEIITIEDVFNTFLFSREKYYLTIQVLIA
ncbi:MAG: MerR family transcriptional regulator [Spirochaetaceae bacterium]